MSTLQPVTEDRLKALDRYFRAANYLSVGQIYLLNNPLLEEPLKKEHIKKRLLGHFGTSPGLNPITPISWTLIGFVWFYCILWAFIEDWAKCYVYRHLTLTGKGHTSFLQRLKGAIHPFSRQS